MQEAFRRVLEEKRLANDELKKRGLEIEADSPIVRLIKDVNKAQPTEAFKQRFAQRKTRFHDLGIMWVDTIANVQIGISYGNIRMPIEQRIRKWKQALTSLKDIPSEERIELLGAMALGMQLTDDHVPLVYPQSVFQRAFDDPFSFFRDGKLGVKFTPQAMLFMEAVGDMSGHSRKQQEEFREFMVRKAGLTGNVGLPQLFPGISRWLDHSKSRIPSQ